MPTETSSPQSAAKLEGRSVLQRWNVLDAEAAASEVLPCCGSRAWAQLLADSRPIHDQESLLECADRIWRGLSPAEWDEAFATHPRIGASKAPEAATARSAQWSEQEQRSVGGSSHDVQQRLADANDAYERRFGRTYIVCATGRSAAEMLAILERRLTNDPELELLEAAEQQRLITRLRLQKWLQL